MKNEIIKHSYGWEFDGIVYELEEDAKAALAKAEQGQESKFAQQIRKNADNKKREEEERKKKNKSLVRTITRRR